MIRFRSSMTFFLSKSMPRFYPHVMRKFLIMFAGAAVLVVAVAATAQPKQQQPAQPDKRFEVKVTPEMRQHSRILDTLYFVGQAYSIIALLIVLATGWSARLRDMARR